MARPGLPAILLPLLLGACKGLHEYQDVVPASPDSLRSALKFEERLENGGSWTIPSERQLAAVDYKSALVITPNKEKLQQLTAIDANRLPPMTPEEELRQRTLKELLEIAREINRRSDAVIEQVRAARSKAGAGGALGAEDVARVQDAMKEEAAQRSKVTQFILKWGESKAELKYKRGTPEFTREVGALTDRFFQDSKDRTKGVYFNFNEFSLLIDSESKLVLKKAKEDEAEVERRATFSLRIRAWDKSSGSTKPLPLHIDNYDDIDNGVVAKQERVSFSPSPAELDRIQKGYELAKEAATLIEDFKAKGSTLRKELSKLVATLRKELKALPATLAILAEQQLKDLVVAAGEVKKAAASSEEEKKLVDVIRTFWADVQSASKGWISLRTQVEDAESAEDLIAIWGSVVTETEKLRELLAGLPQRLAVVRDSIERLEAAVKARLADNSFTDAVKTAMEKAAVSLLPESKAALAKFVGEELSKYTRIGQMLAELGSGASTVAASDSLDLLSVDPRIKALAIDRVLPGTIHIDNTPADRGDKIEVVAEIVGQDSTVRSRETWDFPIERFGLNSSFSTQLIFVNRIGDGELGDPSVRYQAAPAVSWMLHYNVRCEPTGDGFSHFWSFVNPGIGINAAALRFNPTGVDFGAGAQVTLFKDILVAGYGYNFLAHKDRQYFFIGIGLLEALDGVGTLAGFSPKREAAK